MKSLKRLIAALLLAMTIAGTAGIGTAHAQLNQGYLWNCYRAYWVVIGTIWVYIGTFNSDQSGSGVECYPTGGADGGGPYERA